MKGFILFTKKEEELAARDYSIQRLLEAGEKLNLNLKVVCPGQFELVVTKHGQNSVLFESWEAGLPEFIIPRMSTKTSYFGLAILRQLEKLDVYCCNSSRSIERVKDKLHLYQILAESGLPTPRTMMVKFPVDIEAVKREIGFPAVIKNISGTKGEGVYLSDSEDRFFDLMELIYSYNKEAVMIIQEYVSPSSGKDLRVCVIDGKIAGCMLRKSKSGFKAHNPLGGSVEPFPVSKEIESLATKTAQLLELEIAGIDLLFDEDGFKICDANSAPEFEETEKMAGCLIAEKILEHILRKVDLRKSKEAAKCAAF